MRDLKSLLSAAAILLCAMATGAVAQERVALVIGNGDYASARSLDAPVPDAQLMSAVLEQTGFDVTLLTDADQYAMERAISDLGQRLRDAGGSATGLFYYAGHGLQLNGENYLVPVDADIRAEDEIDIYSVQVDRVLRVLLSSRNETNIILLDASHETPFPDLGPLDPQGLAEIEARRGTFVAFSASPDTVAYEGIYGGSFAKTGAFAESLAEAMSWEGRSIEGMFLDVRNSVLQASGGSQIPWRDSRLEGDFFFLPGEPPAEPEPEVVSQANETLARQLWETMASTAGPVQIIGFLRNHPNTEVSDEARMALMKSLGAELTPPEPGNDPTEGMDASPTETDFFRRAQASGSIESYKSYLGTFPDAVFADLAYREIAAQQLWSNVRSSGDPVQVIMFLRSYPDSSVGDDARGWLEAWLDDEVVAQVDGSDAAVDGSPQVSESDYFRRAQASGSIEDYEAYLAEFPNGVFVEIALAEIRALEDAGQPSAPAEPEAEVAAATPQPATPAPVQGGQGGKVLFDQPLSRGEPQVDGRSIAQIIEGSPQYPPIEGLPEVVWKEKTCSDCHQWNRERLCEQANTYLTDIGRFALDKQHPMDGFKQVLADWADGGCE
ncbi:caspase family protein [Amaricoccus macauensis]|uniref:caspase family protein n=1 Tax=Amaricoccus macauensis TaxID=57001 RepID=UPI003C7BDF08